MTLPDIAPDSARDALERAFNRAAGSSVVGGNRLDLLIDGPATYAAMHALIERATRRIHLENYIIRSDDTGEGFAARLIERARAGVRVRVLYDWIGSFSTSHHLWRRLREAGIEVNAFAPFAFADPLLAVSRDHRKLLVVDGKRAVTGGLCIGDEWTGVPAKRRLPWRDTAVAIDGPAAHQLDRNFERAWAFNGGTLIDDAAEIDEALTPAGDSSVRVVATEPGRERAFRIMDLLLGTSATRIWVTEAYLSAPQRMYQAFKDAARDGADVRLLLPGSSDIRAVRNISRIGYRGLLRAGVRIWEWNGPMLHAKTMVADGRWVRIGSSNLNPSSLLANWELDVIAYGKEFAVRMERQFLADLELSSEVLLRARRLPAMIRRDVFPALSRQRPSQGGQPHRPSIRERRTRAIVILGSVVQGARAAIFGPLALMLLAAAILFALFPHAMALISAGLSLATGAALAVRAVGYRARG